jgi:hypothetical protein
MTTIGTTVSIANSPLFVALVSVGATALVTLAVAAMKMVISLAQLKTEVAAIHSDIQDLKSDPDVMKWSNYGRAAQVFQQYPPQPGGSS